MINRHYKNFICINVNPYNNEKNIKTIDQTWHVYTNGRYFTFLTIKNKFYFRTIVK